MKRNVILCVGILMMLMIGSSKNEETGKSEVIAWAEESTETESKLVKYARQ